MREVEWLGHVKMLIRGNSSIAFGVKYLLMGTGHWANVHGRTKDAVANHARVGRIAINRPKKIKYGELYNETIFKARIQMLCDTHRRDSSKTAGIAPA